MSEAEPIYLRPREAGASTFNGRVHYELAQSPVTVFNRRELDEILAVYARKVAAGEWRDYAIDMGRDRAVLSVFRRASEVPLFRIEKTPKLARRQGAYSVVAAHGRILKRGHELERVLAVLEPRIRLVG